MKKVLLKSLYCFAIMLLMVGGVLVLPGLNNAKQTELLTEGEEIVSSSSGEDILKWEKWESTVTESSTSFTTKVYLGQTVNVISSAEELAALSYLVSIGDTEAASAKYLLTADINLIDKLWTPIGNSTTKFSGEFYGDYHKISGIVVAESSVVSGGSVGLFGNVSGSIVDVCVENLVVLNSASETTTGAIVGTLEAGGEVLNCYDLRSSKENYASIGTAVSGSKIYRGGSNDGVNATYTTKEDIDNTITVKSNSATTGYVGLYKANQSGATFRKDGDADWGSDTIGGDVANKTYTKTIKVALSSTSLTTAQTVNASVFSKNIPVLRYKAEGNGSVYVVCEGYKATIPSLTYSNALIGNLTFAQANTSLTINFGYGRTDTGNAGDQIKTITKEVPYDTIWQNTFEGDLKRIGYTLEGIYQNSSLTTAYDNQYIEKLANGATSANLYLKWTSTNINFKLSLGWVDDYSTNGNFNNGVAAAHLPFTGEVVFEGLETTPTEDNTNQDFYLYDGKGHNTSENIVIKFTLKDGYTFANATSWVPYTAGTTGYNIGERENSGVFMAFEESNVDNAQKLRYKIEVTNGNEYTITFEDVVADGDIYLLFKQEKTSFIIDDGGKATHRIAINKAELEDLIGNTFELYAGDYFTLVSTATNGNHIASYSFSNGSSVVEVSSIKADPTDEQTIEQNRYITQYTFTSLAENKGLQTNERNLTLNLEVSARPIYVNVVFDEENSQLNQYITGNRPTISANRAETEVEAGPILIPSSDGSITLVFNKNAYYTFGNVTLDGEPISDISYVENVGTANVSNLSFIETHELKYTITAEKYDLTNEIVIDESNIFTSENWTKYVQDFKFYSDEEFLNEITEALPGQTIYWKLQMANNNTVKRLAYTSTSIVGGTGSNLSSYEDFVISGNFVVGTKDSKVSVKFATKEISFSTNSNLMFIADKNGQGSEEKVSETGINKFSGSISITKNLGEYTIKDYNFGVESLYKGYYLVGWYLMNGEVVVCGGLNDSKLGVEDFFNGLMSDENLNNQINSGVTSFTIVPIYKQKTISIKATHDAGYPTSTDGGLSWSEKAKELSIEGVYYFDHRNFNIDISSLYNNMRRAGYEKVSAWSLATTTGTDGLTFSGDLQTVVMDNSNVSNMQNFNPWSQSESGEFETAVLVIKPVYGTKINYTVQVKDSQGNDKGIVIISINDDLTFTKNGIGGQYASTQTTSAILDEGRNGYSVTGFKFRGNAGTEQSLLLGNGESCKFTLSEEFFKQIVAEGNFIQSGQIFVAQTSDQANKYKVYLGFNSSYEAFVDNDLISQEGAEGFEKYYVEVTFGNEASELEAFTSAISREGYTLAGLKELSSEGGVEYATFDSSWTYQVFAPNGANVGDTYTVYPRWKINDVKYISASMSAEEGLYFNENEQIIVRGSIMAGGESLAYNATANNGERIVSALINGDTTGGTFSQRDLTVAQTNAKNYGEYKLVLTIEDTLNNTRFGTSEQYTIESNSVSGIINANPLTVEGASVQAYFTGKETVAETASSNRGTLQFTHNSQNPVNGLNVSVAELKAVSKENAYNVGTGYDVVYTFVLTEQEGTNYGLTKGEDAGDGRFYYTITASAALEIVPLEIRFNMEPSEQTGFMIEGLYHRISVGSITAYDKDNNDLISLFDFDVTYEYIQTNSDQIGDYTATNFTISKLVVKVGDETISSGNYTWSVVGTYKIVDSATAANIFKYDARYLTAKNGELQLEGGSLQGNYGNANKTFTISYVKDGKETPISGSQFSLADSEGTIFTVIGNESSSVAIAVRKNEEISFKVSITGQGEENLNFLGYFATSDVRSWTATECAPLDNFTTSPSITQTLNIQSASSGVAYYAVYTDVRTVNLYYNQDKTLVSSATANKKVYISSGDLTGVSIANPSMTGFDFASWTADAGLNASVQGDNTVFTTAAGATPVKAVARWTLLVPTYDKVKSLFNEPANSSEQLVIANGDVFTITNRNDTLISYSFQWKKGKTLLGSGESYNFGYKTTAINGNDYVLVVTATYVDANASYGQNTQTQQASPFTFEIRVDTNVISGSVELNPNSLVYNNKNREGDITVKITIKGEVQEFVLGENLTQGDIWFSIDKDDLGVSHIREAGKYTIKLNYNDELYSGSATDATFTIEKDTITLTQDDVASLTKTFGSSNPKLEINYSKNGESIKITFNRAQGESVGNYLLSNAQTTNNNYIIVANELNFVITPAEYALQVALDSTLSYVYNGKAVATIEKEYVSNSEEAWFTSAGWYLKALDSEGKVLAVSRVSLFCNSIPVTTEIEHALDGFEFAPSNAGKDVGTYALANISGSSVTYVKGAVFTGSVAQDKAISISKKELIVTSATKVFDEKADAVWNSQSQDANITLTFKSGNEIVEGENVSVNITFAGVEVGKVEVKSITLAQSGDYANYNISLDEAFVGTITPSSANIAIDATNKEFVYGILNSTNSKDFEFMKGQLQIKFLVDEELSNAIENGYVTVSKISVTSDTSTGGYLKVGDEKVVTITLTSKNYTFGETDVDGLYTKQFNNIVVNITKKDLSLAQTSVVTKPYDGTTNLPSSHAGQSVGNGDGYVWKSTDVMSGDTVTISGSYDSAEIGTRTLKLTAEGDGENYNPVGIPAGQITSVEFTFKTNFEKKEWVGDGESVSGKASFTALYTGSANKQAFIDAINNSSNFGQRKGYTQTGWTFTKDGEKEVKIDNVDLLISELLANGNAITLNAVWEQNNVTITLSYDKSRGEIKNAENKFDSYAIPYFSGTLDLTITGSEGYYFKEYTVVSSENATVSDYKGTRNGTLNIREVKDDITINVVFDYITLTITANDGSHPDASLAADSPQWATSKQFNVVTAGTVDTTLPQYTLSTKSYNLTGWKFEFGENSEEVSVGDERSIWDIVGGENLTENNLDVKVTALWTEAEIVLNIIHTNSTIVSVKVDNEVVSNVGDQYTIHFGDTVVVTFEGNVGYKFAGFEFDGMVESTSASEKGHRTNNTITLTGVKEDGATLTINVETIVVTINSTANKQPYSSISGSESQQYQIKYTDLKAGTTFGEKINYFKTTQTGTYNQTSWKYGTAETTYTNDSNLLEFIKAVYGQEVAETELDGDFVLGQNLAAQWTPVQYTITLNANGGSWDEGQNQSVTVNYGQKITGMGVPTPPEAGQIYTWNTLITGEGKSYKEGDILNTPASDVIEGETTANLTFYAIWLKGNYSLTIACGEHIVDVLQGGVSYKDKVFNYSSGASITFDIQLEEGYRIDEEQTNITAGLDIQIQGTQIIVKNLSENATLTIVATEETYKLNFSLRSGIENVEGAEGKDGNYYINIDFNQAYSATTLGSLVFTRTGYTPSRLTIGKTEIATYADGEWTVSAQTYTTAGDSTVTIEWTRNADYFKATMENQQNNLTYSAEDVVVATGKITAGGAEYTLGEALPNGDILVNYYFYSVGTKKQYGSDKTGTLTLRNVAHSGNYKFVMEVQDIITNEIYKIESDEATFTITPAQMGWSKETFNSYYSGTNEYFPVSSGEDKGHAVIGDKDVSIDATLGEIVFDGSDFNVGSGKDVKVYIHISAEMYANYIGILGDAINGYYLLIEDAGTITATPITFAISGSGLETGSKHEIGFENTNAGVSTTSGVQLDNFNFSVVFVTDAATRTITNFTVKDGTKKVTFKGSATSVDNFVWNASGTYEIKAPSKTISIEGRKLTVNDEISSIDSKFTISNVRYNEKVVVIGNGDFYNHVVNGDSVFTISGNGTNKIIIALADGEELTYDISASNVDGYGLLAWEENLDASALKEILKVLDAEEDLLKQDVSTTQTTLYAVYTDLKYVKVDDGHGGSVDAFAQIGNTTTIAVPTWTGFDFASWKTNGSDGVSAENTTLTVAAGSNILPSTIIAQWTIAEPTTSLNGQTIQITAEYGQQANVSFASVAGNISNENSADLTYSYKWMKDGQILASEKEGLNVDKNTNSNGAYILQITASKAGYVSKTTEVNFTIQVNTVAITGISLSSNNGEYKHDDFAKEITVTLTIGEEKQFKLSDYLTKQNIWFEISYKKSSEYLATVVEQIINAGDYTITLGYDSTVYNVSDALSAVFTVNKKSYKLTQEDASSLFKFFGEADPDPISLTKQFDFGESNIENVEITFTREEGESLGNYDVFVKDVLNDNYDITVPADNNFFEIRKSEAALNITIDNPENFTKVYNAKVSTISLRFDEDSQVWILEVSDGEITVSSNLTLQLVGSGEGRTISGDALKNALQGHTFTFGDGVKAKNASAYPIKFVAGADANYPNAKLVNTADFVITQASLIVDGVTKAFDREKSFVFQVNGVGGEKVSVKGNFKTETVGSGIELEDVAILESEIENIQNYTISEIKTGSITPSLESNITFDVISKAFTYGEIKKGISLEDLLALFDGYTLTIGTNYTSAIRDGYAQISSYDIGTKTFSTGEFLVAGENKITITISSPNYQELIDGKDFEIQITIDKIALDMTGTSVMKEYDGTTNLPDDIVWSIEGVLSGDEVLVDEEGSKFDGANIGEHKVNVVLSGADKEIYSLTAENMPTGQIVAGKVTLNVDAETLLNRDYNSIVSQDGESVKVIHDRFEIAYSDSVDGGAILSTLDYPTRKGFTVTGWQYSTAEGVYEDITAGNMKVVLDKAFAEGKQLTIYAVWKINTVIVTVGSRSEQVDLSVSGGDGFVDNGDGTYTLNYFSSIRVDVKGKAGYMFNDISSLSGEYVNIQKGGVGTKSEGYVSISNVKSNTRFDVDMTQIVITVKVEGNKPEFVDEVTVEGGWESLEKEIAYLDSDTSAKDWLANWTAPEGTYLHTDYMYGDSVLVGEQTLKSIFDTLKGEVTGNFEITFKAVWTGVDYKIVFNVTEGGSIDGDTEISNVKFGQVLDMEFPTASKTGKNVVWKTSEGEDGIVYAQGSTLKDIGTLTDGVYVLNLYTVWSNATYQLTINIGEHIAKVLAGRTVVDDENNTFDLVYSEDELKIVVTTELGYLLSYQYPEEGASEIAVDGNTITISNMSANRTLSLSGAPRENTLTISMQHATIEQVSGGTQEQDKVTAETGSVVTIVFAPEKGYSFVEGQGNVVFADGSQIEELYQDGKLTLTWKNFTSDASIQIAPLANKNTVTFGNNEDRVDSIFANNSPISVSGGNVSVQTGTDLTVVVTLKYGYNNIKLAVSGESDVSIEEGEEKFNSDSRCYSKTFVLKGINEDITLNITSEEREYKVQSVSLEETMGTVESNEIITMKYNTSTSFTAIPQEGYLFHGWYIGDKLVSLDNPYSFLANESMRDYLENAINEENVLVIEAKFGLAETGLTIRNGSNGSLTYNWGDDSGDKTLIENDFVSGTIKFGNTLVIKVYPQEGYLVTKESVSFTLKGSPVDGAWEDYASVGEDGILTITIPVVAGVPDNIEVNYIAEEFEIGVQAVVKISFSKKYGENLGGQLLLADSEGNVIDWGTNVDNPYLEPSQGERVEGANYNVNTATDDKLYFVANINDGYTFNVETSMSGAVVREISRTEDKVFFEISRVKKGLMVYGVFTGQSNQLSIKFQTKDGENVPAGNILVDTSSALVTAPINNQPSVFVNAITTANIQMTVNVGFNYQLAMSGGKVDYYVSDSISGNTTIGEITVPDVSTGYLQRVTINVDSITQNGEIIIYVIPNVYNINFVSEKQVLASVEGITYGQDLVLTEDVLTNILVEREGYSLLGYYTYELGQGVKYVNANGSVVSRWLESGYYWNGSNYVKSPNYDPDTKTFTLYAAWSFDKEKVVIDFIPPELKNRNPDINVADIIINLGSDTSWTSINNKFYAEILEGVDIGLKAYPFEGFTFVEWRIDRDGKVTVHKTEELNYISQAGNVTITAVYRVNFTLQTNNEGGTASLSQDNTNLGSTGSFEAGKDVTIIAKENKGYKFVGWTTADGKPFGDKGVESKNADGTSSWSYTFSPTLDGINLTANFEGDEIGVIIDLSKYSAYGNIISVKVNNEEVDFSKEFTAHVGSEIQIILENKFGYSVIWEGATPRFEIESQSYIYNVKAEDLTVVEGSTHSNVLVLKPVGSSTEISFVFDVRMEEDSQSIENAGKIVYKNADGTSVDVTTGVRINGILYGNTIFLDVTLQPNYKVGYVAIVAKGIHILDFENDYSGYNPVSKRIEIQTAILAQYQPDLNDSIMVIVNFERDLWVDYRAEKLNGEGTESDPYLISNQKELALMAYMINNENDTYYANAYYKLVADIDMSGKFWEPIGTEKNPFNGVFNFDVYSISNMEHYKIYSDPNTSYNGLFWYMTKDAQILVTNRALIIGLSVAGGIILLVLIILLIILLIRRRNKKRLQELANS